MWMELIICSQTSSAADKLGRRKYTNSKDCGILPTGHGLQIGANISAVDSLQEEDGIVDDEKSFKSQILGGQTSKSIWPWMVAVLFKGKQVCGGTVIDERHVLTAAHCFYLPPNKSQRRNPRRFSVQVSKLSRGDSSHEYKIEELKTHKHYYDFTSAPISLPLYNDIAILRLNSPLPSDVTPVCLPTEDELEEGDHLTILGWGLLEDAGTKGSNDLQEIHDVQYMSSERCQEIYSSIIDSQFCSRNPEGQKGPCSGDSGGPVMIQNKRGKYELVGIVSFGFGCGSPKISGAYTKVFSYMQWIQQAIEEGELEEQR